MCAAVLCPHGAQTIDWWRCQWCFAAPSSDYFDWDVAATGINMAILRSPSTNSNRFLFVHCLLQCSSRCVALVNAKPPPLIWIPIVVNSRGFSAALAWLFWLVVAFRLWHNIVAMVSAQLLLFLGGLVLLSGPGAIFRPRFCSQALFERSLRFNLFMLYFCGIPLIVSWILILGHVRSSLVST